MDGKFSNNPSLNEVEDPENSPENSYDSPRFGMFGDGKTTSTSSPKRSKRSVQKKVVSVPVREGDSAPPSDSWAWRKYGQKPIKGSPYPRGYYRCSSSKGCPARKQVERSRVDPTTVVVTYSCDHNHSLPVPKNNHRNHHNNDQQTITITAATSTATIAATDVVLNSDDEKTTVFENQLELDPHDRFSNLGEESMINTYEFKWFLDFESTSSTTTMLESPILDCSGGDAAVIFSMREEDESLFGDLGELPECAVVFRRGVLEREEERQRCNLARWCGTRG